MKSTFKLQLVEIEIWILFFKLSFPETNTKILKHLSRIIKFESTGVGLVAGGSLDAPGLLSWW